GWWFFDITSAYGVLEISGFISNGSKSTTFFGNGLNAAAMKKTLPRLEKTVRKGRSLGENLKEIVLGVKLAEDLELEIGDPVMLLVQTLKGGLNMIDLVLVGTNEGGASDYASAHYVEIHLPTARKLMRMPNRVSRIVIAHNDFDEIRESAVLMQQSLDQTSSVPLRVKDYTETIPGYSINKFFSLISIVVGIVLFFVVGSGIANAMFMSVMERRKEIGTMKAVGAEQSHIRRLFILEGMIIAIVGAVIGLGLASIIVVLVREAGGVPFPPPPGSSIPITIPTIINPSATVFAVILAVVVGIAASYLPARISAKVDPVETLREV
ncbi:MAG: ABC transporter permease, partial [bacterium]|nr:ABC transporter permease [bacterium]